MMPNITRGTNVRGLMGYLVGPGRSNEHTEQHLVAGDPAVMAMYGYDVLDQQTAWAIADDLDQPRRVFGKEITRVQRDVDERTGETTTRRVPADVWHCSLSLRAEEGQLSDERWGQIAQAFMDRMGFTEEGSGRAACRWVAVRHGLSTNGNDHVHIAVSLVREDGTKANTHNDFKRAQEVCRELEQEFGLEQLESREQSRGERGEKPAERATAARRGGVEVAGRRLERAVRGAAAASADEAEFVRRARGMGLLIRPRFAAGRDDVVAGYSVALRPAPGEQVVWYGGGRLARDLTLPRMREAWADSPESAGAAVAEWRATAKNPWQYRPVAPGREAQEVSPAMWQKYTAEVAQLRESLRQIPVEDRAAWAHAARQTAGVLAAWSNRVEATPGPLAETARQLSKSAHIRAHQSRPRPRAIPSVSGAAMILAQAGSRGGGTAAEALLLHQIGRTAVAVLDMHTAIGEATRAREITAAMRSQLAQVTARMPAITATNPAATQTTVGPDQAQRGTGSPVPTRLDPVRPRTPVTPPRRDGQER